MGRCKQLLTLGDKPVIAHSIEAMIRAEIEEIVVVVGPGGDAVAAAVSVYPVKVARNNDPESDMAESVRVGLRNIAKSSTGVLVSLSDNPLISSLTYSLLRECHRMAPDDIIIPVHDGKKGHPTVFPRIVLDQLVRSLTLRDLLRRHSGRVLPVPVPDRGVTLDMDTREDFEKVRAVFEEERT